MWERSDVVIKVTLKEKFSLCNNNNNKIILKLELSVVRLECLLNLLECVSHVFVHV